MAWSSSSREPAQSRVRVYSVNKAVGLASSGVEYAQKYRREIFARIAWLDDYYVFTDYLATNPSVFTDRLGFDRSQVLWIYNLVTGRETLPSTVGVEEVVSMIGQPHAAPQPVEDGVEVALVDSPVRHRIRTTGEHYVDRVETWASGHLIRVEHYDETLNNVEHFHDNRLARRVFYTPDGQVAAEQHYREHEITRTVITPASPLYAGPSADHSAGDGAGRLSPGRRGPGSFRGPVLLEGRSRFFQFVLGRLFSRPDDVVIVDRALDVIDGIYPIIGERRLYSIVHAEHFDLRQVEDGVLLWNNHYENVFTRPDLVDGLIVSTHRQQQVLEHQLASSGPTAEIPVVCIPAGIVTAPAVPAHYDPHALVTASRLADEKHIDILIRAVAEARARLPGLRLDVYGEGDRDRLLAVIEETHTQDCVRLMGHRELAGVLGSYGLYVSASTSEGFGLSLLEAIAEGLPVVGFDVDYGNREMVESGVNGRLLPLTPDDLDASVPEFAAAVVEVLTSASLDDMRQRSRSRAEAYTAERVRKRWERLLRAEARC